VPQNVVATQLPNVLVAAADDQLIPCSRESDIKPFARPISKHVLVQHQNNVSPLEAFEAEDVTVENLIRIPELTLISA
jgi:hypothetical protein